MEYRLVFTIYGLVFMVLLIVTLFFKKRNKSLRTNMYSVLMLFSILFALSECLSIYLLKKTSGVSELVRISWNIRNSFVFIYLFTFIYYFIVMIKPDKYNNFISLFFKNIKNLIILLLFSTGIIVYICLCKFPGFTNEEMRFIGGSSTIPLVVGGIIICLVGLIITYRLGKEKKNYFNCFLLIFILLLIAFPIQLFVKHISLMPFITMFIAFIIYYTVENPDIDLLNDITKLKNNIDNSSNTKTDFLFNLSHDLVSPLNSIVSLSQSLYNIDVDNDTLMNDVSDIKYLGNSLLESIDNILNMSDDKNIVSKKYSLNELLNRINSFTVSKIGTKNISFSMNINDNINSNLMGDINKIQKVLINILSNAVKYTDVGKISLDLDFSVSKDNNIVLHFKISDTGCGIKDEEKSFVFNDSDLGKSGVGLAISKKYIESMNGILRFDSIYGAGSTFYIDIPQVVVDNRVYKDDIININSDEILDISNCKILIVDDDELDIKVTKRYLKKYKCEVVGITSSIECIDRIKSEEKYDLILIDHKMPELSGVEVLKMIKSLEGYDVPVMICLTANVVDGAHDYYKNIGFDDYLGKPIDKSELDGIIKKFLKIR